MPAKSIAQQHLMGMVHAAQKGASPASPKVAKLAKSMSKKSATDFASTKHKGLPKKKKKMKEGYENKAGEIHAVVKPYPECTVAGMVKEINPIHGIAPHSISEDQIHGLYGSQEEAAKVAEGLHMAHQKHLDEIEKKKEDVAKKLTKAIDALEKKRKDHVSMAKEDPKSANKHRENIATLAHQIDDLMSKLSRVEQSKKAKKEEEED
jgi:hypothetical protein